MNLSRENKTFARLLIGISIPIALQELINTGLNMLDILMIGQLGDAEIAGVGLANQIYFLFTLLLLGINSGASIFMAQYWGKKEISNIHKMMGICLFLSCFSGVLFAVAGFLVPEAILSLYSNDAEVIRLGSGYLKLVAGSYALVGITKAYSFSLRSIGETKLPMFVSLFSLVCNGVLNAVLIFGLMGFPAMGVKGAAIATLISRFIEVVLTVYFIKKINFPINGTLKEYFSFDKIMVKAYLGTAGFVILNEIMWSVGTSMYNVGYKFAGTAAQTAVQISTNIQNLFLVVCIGIGSAVSIMLGNLLGAGQTDLAIRYSKKFFVVMTSLSIVFAISLYLSIPFSLSFFKVSAEVYEYTYNILIMISLVMLPKCLNYLIIVGILRSGGDTTYSLILDALGVWIIGVPMAFLGTLVFNLPIYYVVGLVLLEEPVKLIFALKRVKSKKWVKILS